MRFSKLSVFLIVALAFVVSSSQVKAQPTIQLQPYLSGLASPILLTNAKDGSGRTFVVQQGGTIRVAQRDSTTTTEFMNISGRLVSGGERGLLGLTFHPQFADNRKFYVNYTCNATSNTECPSTGATLVSEFTTFANNPNQGNPASERVLLKIPQPFANHNGGMIEFGPDGYLYIGMGDGGSGNDPQNLAQNRSRLLGKMLRIDVIATGLSPYTIPPDNPFVGANTENCPNGAAATASNTCREIFAIGLRNPFRWSFDRGGSRQLYAGDVGQGQLEELTIVTSGSNQGWRVYEGTNCTNLDAGLCVPANYTMPIYEYFNANSPRCSVTGGYVYRGRRGTLPQGTYLFSDFCTGEIMTTSSTPRNPTVLIPSAGNVASFGEDEQGELYVVDINGSISRIVNPNAAAPRNITADFDGDLRTDISTFRASSGTWNISNSLNNSFRAVPFGASTDRITPADFDGDGKTDVAVFRNGDWFWLDSATNTFRAFRFGTTGDIPLPADYNGDGKSDHAVFRGGTWFIWNSGSNSLRSVSWGFGTDTPVPADYDGDGQTDVAVWRASTGDWYLLRSRDGSAAVRWGTNGDTPVTGDYDGDGRFDVAVWRGGTWFALQSSNNALYARQWGLSTDTPVPGDYEGDGKTDPAVARNGGGTKTWFILQSINGAARSAVFGLDTDSAVPAFDVP
jgi:glucose/arabinose dehydrogenase